MPLGSSLLSLQAGVVRLINKVCLAQVRRAAKGRDYSVMKCDMALGEQKRAAPLEPGGGRQGTSGARVDPSCDSAAHAWQYISNASS